MKNNRGITLIALVITIIILLILAGISVSMLMGENGLITKTKQGAMNYQNASLEEQTMLNNLYTDFASELAKSGSADAVINLIAFKRTIANAITNAGVTTSENDSAETMATNIGQIKTLGHNEGYDEGHDDGVVEGETHGSKVYYLGTGRSFNIAELLPNDYQNLTSDNFIAASKDSAGGSGGSTYLSSCYYNVSANWSSSAITCSYNAETGILTVSGGKVSTWVNFSSDGHNSSSGTKNLTVHVWCIIGNIEQL